MNGVRNRKRSNKGAFKKGVCAFIGFALIIGFIVFSLYYDKNRERLELAREISNYGPRKGVPRSIEDLKRAIAAYEKLQEQHVKDAAQTGVYWKILSSRFQDKQMYFEAIEALKHAIDITPDDETLHYLLGLNAAYAAKSAYDYGGEGAIGERARRYFELAETAHLRSIELEPKYNQARFALSVLYIYELNRPEDGIKQLVAYMENRSNDADAMLMMARAFYMLGRYREAVDWYDRAIPLIKDEGQKAEADENRRYVLGLM
ncbi:MAG: tetratricopeptide repeat protein [Spirochaetaceae bacterium]|jgi:tetratricopeptide (TPR) repeat protein|nr:tetratricopeptide repeat protein [Spirochaetaceae bacterium]